MSEPLRPQFYILRPNGSRIALIAMDELPHNLVVQDIPRVLSPKDVLHMKGVDEVEPRHQTYRVSDTNQSAINSLPAQVRLPSLPASIHAPIIQDQQPKSSVSTSALDEIFPGVKKYYGIQEQKSDSDDETNILNHNAKASVPVPSIEIEAFGKYEPLPEWKKKPEEHRFPPPGKKVYCSHWLSTGECDYAQQGCLYKHHMPLDLPLLNHLGFQDIPKWYRDRHGIGRLTAVPGSDGHIQGASIPPHPMQGNWRSSCTLVKSNRGTRPPTSAPVTRALTRPTRSTPSRRIPERGSPIAAQRFKPRDTLDADLLLLSSPRLGPTKVTNSLLNSKYAPIAPSTASSVIHPSKKQGIRPSSSSGSDVDHSISSQVAHSGSTPGKPIEHLPCLSDSNTKPSAVHRLTLATRWSRFANDHSGSENASSAGYNTAYSRRTSVASDYEADSIRRYEAHDEKEARMYEETKARLRSQQEQKKLNRMQEIALASAKAKLQDEDSASLSDTATSGGSEPGKLGPVNSKKKAVRSKTSRGPGSSVANEENQHVREKQVAPAYSPSLSVHQSLHDGNIKSALESPQTLGVHENMQT